MYRAILIAALSLTPVQAGNPLALVIDGATVGTVDRVEYDTLSGQVLITTRETVYGCKTDRVFSDNFSQ